MFYFKRTEEKTVLGENEGFEIVFKRGCGTRRADHWDPFASFWVISSMKRSFSWARSSAAST